MTSPCGQRLSVTIQSCDYFKESTFQHVNGCVESDSRKLWHTGRMTTLVVLLESIDGHRLIAGTERSDRRLLTGSS